MLKLFDSDQTHDLIWAEKIDSRIINLIANKLGNHSPFADGLFPITLVDRIVPNNLPWAENWSTVFYEFLKPLSRTHILTNGELNGEAYGFDPEYKAELPNSLNLPDFPEEITLKVPKGQTVSISWLERSHSEIPYGRLCAQVPQPICIWSRRGSVYSAPSDSDLEVKFDSRLWLINSCVIQGQGELKGLSNAQKELILYQFLDNTLEAIYSQLNISNCQVLTGFDGVVTTTWQLVDQSWLGRGYIYSNYHWGSYRTCDYANPLFQFVPSGYHNAYFQKAGTNQSNFWSMTTILDSGNNTLDFDTNFTDNYFDYYRGVVNRYGNLYEEIKIDLYPNRAWMQGLTGKTRGAIIRTPSPDGREILNTGKHAFYTLRCVPTYYSFAAWQPVTKQVLRDNTTYPIDFGYSNTQSEKLIAAYCSENNTIYQLAYFTYQGIADDGENILYAPGGWRHWRKLGNAEDFSMISVSQYLDFLPPHAVFGEFFVGPFSKRCRFHEFRESYRNVFNQVGANTYSVPDTNSFRELLSDFDDSFGAIIFSPDVDPNLFKSGQVAYINSTLTQRKVRTSQWVESVVFSGQQVGGGTWAFQNERYSVDQISEVVRESIIEKLDISLNSEGEIPNIIKTTVLNQSESLYSSSVSGLTQEVVGYETSGGAIDRPVFGDLEKFVIVPESGVVNLFTDGLMTKTVIIPMRRELRIQPKGEENLVKTFVNNYPQYNPIDEEDLEDFAQLFDPDTDNGDIMPDSLRIKEIHQALQADKYSKDDNDPNLARVANLGWLINRMAHVLGLHYRSDGAMVKPPDTKHLKDGDKIPENWQIAQFGKNKWKDKDGKEYDGVGIAYEVRSNGFTSNRFGETLIEEGGWVLCNSLIQYLETKMDDDDRAFGLQEMGANVVPKADGNGFIVYEGLHSLLIEVAYMLSAISGNTAQNHVLGLKNNAMLQELLASQGVPITLKEIICEVADQTVKIPYPGVRDGSPSMADMNFWILSNLAPLVASTITTKED